jgi:hypothetical protein
MVMDGEMGMRDRERKRDGDEAGVSARFIKMAGSVSSPTCIKTRSSPRLS